jgi:RNA polymerase sigma factor (sigma-70 family)
MEPTEDRKSDNRLGLLMRAAQGGDAEAYGALLHEMASLIRHVVYSKRPFLTPEDIEDLVQDVLLSVHSVRSTYNPNRPFMPWLLAIVRNRISDAARRYGRTRGRELRLENMDVTFSVESTNSLTESYGDAEALKLAIGSLPDAQRTAIEMLKLREMSLKEAARASGSSIGALKVATHRAIDSLRKKLTKKK